MEGKYKKNNIRFNSQFEIVNTSIKSEVLRGGIMVYVQQIVKWLSDLGAGGYLVY